MASRPLQVTADGDPEREKFYRTHYAPADLGEKKTARLAAKLNQPPELVVFQKVSEEGNCSECGAELPKGEFLLMEKGQPLCLACADLDQLVFLPAGDAALSRRARKYSSLAAVVVRFSRARKRYERQGLLVRGSGPGQGGGGMRRRRAGARRCPGACARSPDRRKTANLWPRWTGAISQRYPGCPAEEARRIAEHTGRRSSGRVGRSAAGRALDASSGGPRRQGSHPSRAHQL